MEQQRSHRRAGAGVGERGLATAFPPPPLPPPPPRIGRRLRKLRIAVVALFALLLAGISFLYGIFIAVASDLPQLEDRYQFTHAKNSYLLDEHGRPLAVLSMQHRILLSANQIPRIVKDAVIAVEDRRFYSEPGIDIKGIIRAALADLLHGGAVEGGSTITEQFVKNALAAQSHRTIFEKLREAALAFQLAHKWPKEKILAEYLDTIYFGEGAYGIEAAAQTYFGHLPGHLGCGMPGAPLCVSELTVGQAALLAGIIASPGSFDPVIHPLAARERRDLVLKDMLGQHYITRPEYERAMEEPLPPPQEVQPPSTPPVEGLQTGYFTSWVENQLIEKYGAQRALEGGLRVKTTLDLGLQRIAEAAVQQYVDGPGQPSAALVAIENASGAVRAMVGGKDFETEPFNLATESERQPGSAFKAFDLAAALEEGISPYSLWTSKPKVFVVPGTDGREKFYVHNDQNAYAGERTLIEATAYSDNSVFAELGIDVGTAKIAAIAHRMGIETPISTNPAMTIGGLEIGVSPLEMAHAYETLAQDGQRVNSSILKAGNGEPTGIEEVVAPPGETLPDGSNRETNHPQPIRVLPPAVAETETRMLETVLQYGTARLANLGVFAAGKTGTTSNYVDAWFVGFDKKFTVAVWVGYPAHPVPMDTQYNGGPVEGGTFPALIWHAFMVGAMQLEREAGQTQGAAPSSPASRPPESQPTPAQQSAAPSRQAAQGGQPAPAGGGQPAAPQRPAPPSEGQQRQQPAKEPEAQPPPTSQGEGGEPRKPEAGSSQPPPPPGAVGGAAAPPAK